MYDYIKKPKDETTNAKKFSNYEPVPYLMFNNTPDVDIHIESEQQRGVKGNLTHVVTNKYGFRYHDNLEVKKSNEVRIFLIGGSVVFKGLTNDRTISGYLERMLNDRFGEKYFIRVINCGIVSAVSDQELALLLYKVVDLKPDIVIVFDGFNDVYTPQYYEPRIGYPFNFVTHEQTFNRVIDKLSSFDKLISASMLAARINKSFELKIKLENMAGKYLKTEREKGSFSVEEVAGHLFSNWQKMSKIADSYKFNIIFIVQPVNPAFREREGVKKYFDLLHDMIRKERGIGNKNYFSFSTLLGDHPEYFWDVVHTYDEGNYVYAEKMKDILINYNYLR
ncbi:MAG: SGNH/GDSL hydrolase family protein [Nitrospirae bacterium YQR-1]